MRALSVPYHQDRDGQRRWRSHPAKSMTRRRPDTCPGRYLRKPRMLRLASGSVARKIERQPVAGGQITAERRPHDDPTT